MYCGIDEIKVWFTFTFIHVATCTCMWVVSLFFMIHFINFTLKIFQQVSTFVHIVSVWLQVLQFKTVSWCMLYIAIQCITHGQFKLLWTYSYNLHVVGKLLRNQTTRCSWVICKVNLPNCSCGSPLDEIKSYRQVFIVLSPFLRVATCTKCTAESVSLFSATHDYHFGLILYSQNFKIRQRF